MKNVVVWRENMPSNYGLKNYISLLNTLGKNRREIWQSIRKHQSFKFSSDVAIERAIKDVANIKASASSFRELKAGSKLSSAVVGQQGSKGNRVNVSFKFSFDFGESKARSKQGRNAVHLSAHAAADMTKSDINEMLKELAREWIEENYPDETEKGKGLRVTVTGIERI